LHPEFEEVIIVKTKIKQKLDIRLRRARTLLPDVVGTGGTCDAYQPAEKTYKNTRQVLEVLLKYKYPVLIGTKNTLFLRDIDLISQINKASWCTVACTITSFKKQVVDFLEPRASTSEDRINALKKVKEEHPEIQTGVHYMPIVPLLEDSDDQLEEVVSRAKEAGCDFILFAAGMSMRDNQAEFFKKKLKERYPNLFDEFLSLYQKGSMWGNPEYVSAVNKKVYDLCKKYNIAIRSKRWIPKDYRRVNYLIAEKLLNESYELEILGKPDKQMHWAGLNLQNLEDSLFNLPNYKETLKVPKRLVQKIDGLLKKFEKNDAIIKNKKDLTSFF